MGHVGWRLYLEHGGFKHRRIVQECLRREDFKLNQVKKGSFISQWHRGKKQQPNAEAAKSSILPIHDEANERREDPRINIDSTARLEVLDKDHTTVGELEVSIVDVSASGARILIAPGMLGDNPDELSFLRLHFGAGPLAGVSDEVKRVYHLASESGVQMGIAWSAPAAEVCERVKQLVDT